MNDIIFMGEKSKYLLLGWPGDEYHARTNESINTNETSAITSNKIKNKNPSNRFKPYTSKKPKLDTDKPHNDQDNRPSSMKSRYFSIENVQKINESETVQTDKNRVDSNESEQFIQRRDYLIKKLMQSRTLPEPTQDETNETKSTTTSVHESSSKTNVKLFKPDRKHSFQGEFIPLTSSSSNSKQVEKEEDNEESSSDESVKLDEPRKDYNPKVNTLESYKGPYPIKCLMRTRQYLIDCFKPYSTLVSRSNYEDRIFEILKMKMNIKSKFDDDTKLWRKIKRDTAIERRAIIERIDSQNKRYTNYMQRLELPRNSHKYIAADTSTDEDIDDVDSDCVFEKVVPKNDNKNVIEIDLNDDDDDEFESNNLIKMISNVETYENLDYEEDENDDIESVETISQKADPDSKCVQFGNYSKKNVDCSDDKNLKLSAGLRRKSKNSKKKQKQQSKNDKSGDDKYRIDRVGLKISSKSNKNFNSSEDELAEWESKYKKLRNQRNKLLRKKKSFEINTQRELMSDELKKIRKIMKKIRKNSKSKFKKTSFNTNSSSHKSKKIKI